MSDEAYDRRKSPSLFRKGQSGNPSGRPHRVEELRALSQANFPLAVQRLGELIKSRDDEMAFKALSFCFAYVLGRPPEGRDLMHVETMRARLTELVAVNVESEETPAALPPSPPERVVETLTAMSADSRQTEPPPPEALDAVTPVQASSGLKAHCLYRGKDGPCMEPPLPTSQWCEPHRTKLFSLVTE